MPRRVASALGFLLAFAFFNLCFSAELFIGSEDVPFELGTYAEYTQNADMFFWTQFDSTATMWDLTVYPGESTATVRLLDPSQGNPPAPDTFPSAELVELDTLGDGSEAWTYMSKDAFYLYVQGIDFVVTPFRFIGNYQPDARVYLFPIFYGSGWITSWTWTYNVGIPYTANEMHLKQVVAKGWVKTEITGGQYWPCLVIRDNYTFSDNFGTTDLRWLYEWVVAGRFAGGNGIAAALSPNGASKDFIAVDKMLRMKSLNVPGWDLTCPVFDSTTVWTDTSFAGPYPVSSIITDPGGIGGDSLFYSVDFGSFTGVGHDSLWGDKYYFTIPEVASSCTISYYLWAEDSFSVVNSIDIWTTDPEAAPENNLITFVVTLTAVEEKWTRRVEQEALRVFPNPFSSSVRIDAGVAWDGGPARINIFDQAGRLVRTFNLAESPENSRGTTVHLSWTGTDELNRPVPSGMYFVTLEQPSSPITTHATKLVKIR